jgi:hypothetical protein
VIAEIEAEAPALIADLTSAGVAARLVGGLAVSQHVHYTLPGSLSRTYEDIDIVASSDHRQQLRETIAARGYSPNDRFNSLHGSKRLLFYDEEHGRQLDVFIGELRMSHTLDLSDRLAAHPTTLPPADLLLTKLQIVELNAKDIVDALALVHQHELANDRDGDVMAVDRLEAVTRQDWGWFTTVQDNVEKLAAAAGGLLEGTDLADVTSKLEEIRQRLEAAPKSMRWKARARVGRRLQWYELPEEVARG